MKDGKQFLLILGVLAFGYYYFGKNEETAKQPQPVGARTMDQGFISSGIASPAFLEVPGASNVVPVQDSSQVNAEIIEAILDPSKDDVKPPSPPQVRSDVDIDALADQVSKHDLHLRNIYAKIKKVESRAPEVQVVERKVYVDRPASNPFVQQPVIRQAPVYYSNPIQYSSPFRSPTVYGNCANGQCGY